MRKLLLPFLLLIAPFLAFADGNGTLGNTYTFSKCGLNFTTVSQRIGQRFPANNVGPGVAQPAPFTIAGVPPCATIEKAYLYAEGSGNNATQTATIVGPAGTQSFPMTLIGSTTDKCWGYQHSVTYRADVTSVIAGDFTYMVSGLLVDPTIAHTNDMDGATLVVIYSDPTVTWQGTLQIDDGAIERSGGQASYTMNITAPCGTPTNSVAFMGIGDLQDDNSTPILNGNPYGPYAHNWWNYFQVNTTVTAAQTTSTFSNSSPGDCWNLAFIGLYYQTTTCTVCTPPTLTLTSSSTPSTCGLCNGTATVVATGSPFGYTYTWLPTGGNAATATGLCAGTYTVRVTTLCNTDSAIINVPLGPGAAVLTHTQTNPECNAYCDGIATITATGGTPPYAYVWSPTGGNSATATALCAGTYIATITDSAGCINKDTVVITQPAPTPPPIPHDTAFCQLGPSGPLVADPSTTGDIVRWWSTATGGTFSLTPPTPVTDVTGTFTWYVSDVTPIGCESVRVPVNVLIKNKPLYPVISSYVYCQYSGVNVLPLSAQGDSIQWYTTTTGGLGTLTPPQPTIDSPGTFIWYVTQTQNGCESDRAPQVVKVKPGVIANFGFDVKLGCGRDTLMLTDSSIVNGVESVIWDFGDSSPFETFDHNPRHLYYTTGTYPVKLFVTNSYCSDSMTKDVFALVNSILPLEVSPKGVTICPGDSVQLHAIGDASYTFNWTPNLWVKNGNTPDPFVRPESSLAYTATATDTLGCQHIGIIKVDLASNAIIAMPDSVLLYPGESYQLNPQGNCMYFSWFPHNGLNVDNISNPIAQPEVDTRYIVHGSTEWGCTTTDSIDVFVTPGSSLYLPNAFAPGSTNPENREFRIIKRGIATLKSFRVYDRWGILVYESTDIDKGWDGTYKGKPQPFGVYVYTVEAVTSTGEKFAKQGNVTLLR